MRPLIIPTHVPKLKVMLLALVELSLIKGLRSINDIFSINSRVYIWRCHSFNVNFSYLFNASSIFLFTSEPLYNFERPTFIVLDFNSSSNKYRSNVRTDTFISSSREDLL